MAEMNKQRLLVTFATTLFIFILMLVLLMIISHFTGALKDVADKVRLGLMPWKKPTKRVFPEIASLDAAFSDLHAMQLFQTLSNLNAANWKKIAKPVF